MDKPSITVTQTDSHRNGVTGAPFYVVQFTDKDTGPMLGIVFDEARHVAVFNRDKLAAGETRFGYNSWRGDYYEPSLRDAIRAAYPEDFEE
jgi:hypothetical protein